MTPAQLHLLDQLIELYMRDNFTPGLILSIVRASAGEEAEHWELATAYGQGRVEANVMATNHTLFYIASVSKSFTALVTCKTLHEKFPELGEAVLDAPIRVLAPDFNFALADKERCQSTSFRDLLSHRTGLFNAGLDLHLGANSSATDYAYRTRYQLESKPFRSGFEYNNSVFTLAGEAVAHIAGCTFQDLMEKFFLQIGMRESRLIDGDGAHEELPTMSHAYFRRDGMTAKYRADHLRKIAVATGAGTILSTSADMALYLKLHLDKGRLAGVQIIPEDVYGWVLKPAIPVVSPGPGVPGGLNGVYAYGLGLGVAVNEGKPWILHSGYWAPYESMIGLYPEQGVGIFTSTNGPGRTGNLQQLQTLILDIVQGKRTTLNDVTMAPRYPTSSEPNRSSKSWRPPGSRSSKTRSRVEPDDIIGCYGSPADGDAEITLDNTGADSSGGLAVNFGTCGVGALTRKPGSETVFEIEWVSPVEDDFCSWGPHGAGLKFEADFGVEGQFELRSTSGEKYLFVKGLELAKLKAKYPNNWH